MKLAFDREGIKFPFPQRERHFNVPGGVPADIPLPADATRPAGPA